MQEVLLPVLGISAVIGVASLSVIVVRFASAFARRLEARPPDVAPPDAAIGDLREELDAVQERLDFLERALVSQRHHDGRALPAPGERGDRIAHTPS
jgi:Na+-transporting methylmalonyl-CoA/oxaloacetate decarboxylase gamma subunit